MIRTHKKLAYFLGALFAITVVFRVIPSYLSAYKSLHSDRESLRQELTYHENLADEEEELKQRAEEIAGLVTNIENSVFSVPANLLGSEVQAIIRNVSGRTGVEIREMRVAKIESFEDWLKVSQEMNFTISQNRILPFLHALRAHEPRLYVKELTVTRSRQQFVGSLTIEAFSRP
jgi:hypothetical protein